MSEDKSRFKIRKGEIEIEFEGKSAEVTTRYDEAFEWVKTEIPAPKKRAPKEEKKAEEEKKEKRGGVRTAVISPEIDRLADEGWMDDFKEIEEITAELEKRAVPGLSPSSVANALRRRVGKTLERMKTKEGKWIYRARKKKEE